MAEQGCPCLSGGTCTIPFDHVRGWAKEGKLRVIHRVRVHTSGLWLAARHRRKIRREIKREMRRSKFDHAIIEDTFQYGPMLSDGVMHTIGFYRES